MLKEKKGGGVFVLECDESLGNVLTDNEWTGRCVAYTIKKFWDLSLIKSYIKDKLISFEHYNVPLLVTLVWNQII